MSASTRSRLVQILGAGADRDRLVLELEASIDNLKHFAAWEADGDADRRRNRAGAPRAKAITEELLDLLYRGGFAELYEAQLVDLPYLDPRLRDLPPHEDPWTKQTKALVEALDSFSKYLDRSGYLQPERRGPKADLRRWNLCYLTAGLLESHHVRASKHRKGKLALVLDAIWPEAIRGERPPKDLFPYLKAASDGAVIQRAWARQRPT